MFQLNEEIICEKIKHLKIVKNAQLILTANQNCVVLLDDHQKLINIPLKEPDQMNLLQIEKAKNAETKPHCIKFNQDKFLCISYSSIDSDRIACLNVNGPLQICKALQKSLIVEFETKLERITSFKFNPTNSNSLVLVHGSNGINRMSLWNYIENTCFTREIDDQVFSYDWAADGHSLTITTYKNEIKIFDFLLIEKISFEEKRREKAILLNKTLLFHCGGLNNQYKFGLYEINYEVKISFINKIEIETV